MMKVWRPTKMSSRDHLWATAHRLRNTVLDNLVVLNKGSSWASRTNSNIHELFEKAKVEEDLICCSSGTYAHTGVLNFFRRRTSSCQFHQHFTSIFLVRKCFAKFYALRVLVCTFLAKGNWRKYYL